MKLDISLTFYSKRFGRRDVILTWHWLHCTAVICSITIAWIHHESLGNQYSELCHKLLWGRCSDIMNVLETRLHVKWMRGKKWSSLDLNIFLSAPENCFCFGPSTWYLFANHKESQRSTECPLCLCTVSAAVVAKIVLKSRPHMCQLSSCHRKVRKARVWKEICSRLTLFKLQERQNTVEWQGGPVGKQTLASQSRGLDSSPCSGRFPFCWSVLEQEAESSAAAHTSQSLSNTKSATLKLI